VENRDFSYSLLQQRTDENCLRIFSGVFFSQPIQLRGLSGGVNRFWKKSSVRPTHKLSASQTDRQIDRQTDGNAISIAQRLLLNARLRAGGRKGRQRC